ncbi:MAG: DUF1572 family protein [Gemmatimonadetes bacterium]|nr:DUF1572 family protein [Gemmatimonadota bacterium]
MDYHIGQPYLSDIVRQLEKLRRLAEDALRQVTDEQFFLAPDPDSNSLALIVKHVAGNMRSRWRDFLTADGEKPDRDRDREFEREATDTRAALMDRWEEGWSAALSTIRALRPDDLHRTVTLRGEPHTVLEAINRQVTHYAYHVGQIVYLAKHLAGPSWRTLSIPRGRSRGYDVRKDGEVYRPKGGG